MVQKHFGQEVFEKDSPPFSMVVELARTATEAFFENGDMSGIEDMVSVLGVERDQVSDVLWNSFSRVEETAAHLCIDTGSDQDIPHAMEKANHALSKFLSEKPNEGSLIF
jgi:hypothetical protein